MMLAELKREVLKRSLKIKRVNNKHIIAGCMVKSNRKIWKIKMNAGHKTTQQLEKYYVEPLKSSLKLLGILGTKPSPNRNFIGNCAEQRACNEVIRILPYSLPLDHVEYTPAYRLRTAQVRDYCDNCIMALGIHN